MRLFGDFQNIVSEREKGDLQVLAPRKEKERASHLLLLLLLDTFSLVSVCSPLPNVSFFLLPPLKKCNLNLKSKLV